MRCSSYASIDTPCLQLHVALCALHYAYCALVMQFKVAALINDSVGTLAGGCYVDADTKIGVILGTGTNACYAEQRSNIAALAKSGQNGREQQHPLMAINTEWGNFAAPSTPFTDVSPATAARAQALHGSAGDEPALSAGRNTV